MKEKCIGRERCRQNEKKSTAGFLRRVLLSFLLLQLLTGCGSVGAGQTAAVGAAENEMIVSETAAATAADSAYGNGAGFLASTETETGASGRGTLTSKARSAESLSPEQLSASQISADSDEKGNAVNRKLIRSVSIDAETNQFDSTLSAVQERIAALDGYTEQLNSHSPSGDSTSELRNAYIRARIPADRLDEFLNTAFEGLHVTNRSETTQDVTLQYTDIDARERVLRVEQERLMELLAEAQSADSLIALEQRLSEIRYEIESLTSQLRVYDNQVQYSTVDISLSEVRTVSATADDGFGAQMQSGFLKNLRNVGIFLRNAALFLLTGVPVILPVAVILILVYSISKWVRKRTAHQKDKEPGKAPSENRMEQEPETNAKDSSEQHAADDKAGKTGIHRS